MKKATVPRSTLTHPVLARNLRSSHDLAQIVEQTHQVEPPGSGRAGKLQRSPVTIGDPCSVNLVYLGLFNPYPVGKVELQSRFTTKELILLSRPGSPDTFSSLEGLIVQKLQYIHDAVLSFVKFQPSLLSNTSQYPTKQYSCKTSA